MRKVFHILTLLFIGAVLFASCARNGKVIPRKAMMDIYYDMFLADQWLNDHSQARKTADTTFFYEPIFEKHGYTFKDFDHSVSHYLKDPEKYSKMLKEVSKRLDKKSKELEKVRQAINNYHEPQGYEPTEFRADSLIWVDSLVLWVRPVPEDTLAVSEQADSIMTALRDSLLEVLQDSTVAALSDSALFALRDSLIIKTELL